jgi:hypothetical protein
MSKVLGGLGFHAVPAVISGGETPDSAPQNFPPNQS